MLLLTSTASNIIMNYSISRRLCFLFITLSLIVACSDSATKKDEVNADSTGMSKDNSPKSIPSETKKWVGNTNITINYTAPAVRGRVIWGELVPYDKVWVTGAHMATTLEVGKDFKVGDKIIPAGKYAIFTIPGKEEWTIILNKNWDQHQADEYSATEDVVRIKVKPELTEQITERLNYTIDQTGEGSANIIISWEKIRLAFGIAIMQ